jgi:excisionase family DNA binding protein
MKVCDTQFHPRKNLDSPRVPGLRSSDLSSGLVRSADRPQEKKSELLSPDSALSSRKRKQLRVEKDVEFEPLLDACEAANLLRIHPKTIQRLARLGYVPAFRVGKFWRYRASDLEKWLRSGSHSSCQLADRVDFTKEKN